MNLDGATLTVVDFKCFNPRKDISKPSWFRVDNSISTSQQFFRFTAAEKWVWIYILSHCSQHNTDSFTIDLDYHVQFSGATLGEFKSAIHKLLNIKAILIDVTSTSRPRNVHERKRIATEITEITEKTDIYVNLESENGDISPPAHSTGVEVQTLVDLWNENRGQLAKVKELNENRKRLVRKALKERPDLDQWKRIVKFLARDEFYSGRKPGSPWKANFDFLIRSGKHVELFEKVPTPRQPDPDFNQMPTIEEALAKLGAERKS